MERENCDFRVLSIQSHVVSGYVGNRSACFPLQVLGFDVDFINTVQLSNHTGYVHFKGQLLNADDLQELYDGLKLNGLLKYSHILTGYVGTVTFLSRMVEIIKELKEKNPNLYFICDPVMGDNGKMYVPEEVLPLYRDFLVPMADIITPNQYETELLTGISIKSEKDAVKAMNAFHDKGVRTVVISSADIGDSGTLSLFGSSVKGGNKTVILMEIPKLQAVFTGTGDLFAALLLAWMAKTDGNLKVSCEKAINTLQSILKRTLNYAKEHATPKGEMSKFLLELKLVQSKNDIEEPPTMFKCVLL